MSLFLIVLQAFRGGGGEPLKPATLLKRDSNTGAFLLSMFRKENVHKSLGEHPCRSTISIKLVYALMALNSQH